MERQLRLIQRLLMALVSLIVAAVFAVMAWQNGTRNPANLSMRDLGRTAGEAYIFGYPLLVMDQTRSNMLGIADSDRGPGFYLNRLTHIRQLPRYGDDTVVRPNLDTLYSIAWLDLSEGPVILRWPNMEERYWLFQVLDGWTDVAGAPGARTQGSGPGAAMIAGPNWDGPALPGMVHIRVETEMAWILGRIAVSSDEADLVRARLLQDEFTLTGPEITEFPTTRPARGQRPPDVIAALETDAVMDRLARLLAENPARPEDDPIRSRLFGLGVVSRYRLDNGWIAERAMQRGVTVARERLEQGVAERPYGPTGWRTLRTGVGDYGTDYALRAGVALIGLGANLPEDAIYPTTDVDATGTALDGRFDYTIRFEPDALPPAEAFWSITAYDADGFLMSTMTPAHLSHRDVVYDADGGLTLTIGAPDLNTEQVNHIPVAPEPFQLTARLYLPEEAALAGEWEMPPVERLN
jgi:hypothetical protein